MARRGGLSQIFTPVKGFVTEFTPTQFPSDAAVDIDNCIIDIDGSVRRRPGLSYEVNYVLNQVDSGVLGISETEDLSINTFLWENVNNSGTFNIVVVQVGLILQFYPQVGTISSGLIGELDISPFVAGDIPTAKSARLSYTQGLGNLYITNDYMQPTQITYIDGVGFIAISIPLYERDFTGVDDSLSINERPLLLTPEHYYNLLNQGWNDTNLLIFAGLPSTTSIEEAMVTTGTLAAAGSNDWPSNADIMYLGFTVDGSGNPVFERSALTQEHYLGTTPAPKGHFVIDAFTQNRNNALRSVTIPIVISTPGGDSLEDLGLTSKFPEAFLEPVNKQVSTKNILSSDSIRTLVNRPPAIAFHNGKLFYARNESTNLSTGVYYSRTLISTKFIGQCFPEADPTAEEINELIATDGGFVSTPNVGEILTLSEFHNGVLIGASNGIWYLTGADVDSGFTATSNRLVKISDTGLLSVSSYVNTGSTAYYFSLEGIMVVTLGQIGIPTVTNLTEKTIQAYYVSQDKNSLSNAIGIHIPEQRKVYWGFVGDTDNEHIDTILVLDLNIGGFYKYSIAVDNANDYPRVLGFTSIPPLVATEVSEDLTTISGETIYLIDGVTPVTSTVQITSTQFPQLKLLTAVNSTVQGGWLLTFSEFNSRSFKDWDFAPLGGVNYSSYIEFGYNYMGAVHTRGTAIYVHSYFSKESKNLKQGGYYELPSFSVSGGFRPTQSVVEGLYTGTALLRPTQSIVEGIYTGSAELRTTQSVTEFIWD
jgi:hypothetical protein